MLTMTVVEAAMLVAIGAVSALVSLTVVMGIFVRIPAAARWMTPLCLGATMAGFSLGDMPFNEGSHNTTSTTQWSGSKSETIVLPRHQRVLPAWADGLFWG